MEWLSYPKITKLSSHCNEWVAVEKIHGCNMSIHVKGKDQFEFYRRKGKIEPGESFHEYENVFERYTDSLNQLYDHLGSEYILYGEYFGGPYHPEDKHKTVQKGIKYCSGHDFVPFDLVNSSCHWVDYDGFMEKMKRYTTFKLLEPLARGTLDVVSAFDVERRPTTIPTLYGLPDVPDNFMEGVVIRPVQTMYDRYGKRVIFKKKSAAFTETDTTQKCDPNTHDPQLDAALKVVCANFTAARLDNVMSKLPEGPLKFKDVLREFVEDAVTDAVTDALAEENSEYADRIKRYPNDKQIHKVLKDHASPFVRKKLFG